MSTTRKVVAVTTALLVVGTGTAAYAYWTTGGSGTGTAATAAGEANKLVIASYTAPANLAPGVTSGPVTAKVQNTSTTASYHVSSVTVSITGVTQAPGAVGSCTASDYALTGAVMTDGAGDLATGATSTDFTGANVVLKETGANQDGCKGATVNLAFAIA